MQRDALKPNQVNKAQLLAIDDFRHVDPEESLQRARSVLRVVPRELLPLALGVLGSSLRIQGHAPEAHKAIATGLLMAQELNAPTQEADLLQRASYIVGVEYGEYREALRLTDEALVTYALAGDPGLLGRAMVDRGTWWFYLQHYDSAERSFQASLQLLPSSSKRNRFAAFVGIGRIALARDNLADALCWLRAAIAIGEDLAPLILGKGQWLYASYIGTPERRF